MTWSDKKPDVLLLNNQKKNIVETDYIALEVFNKKDGINFFIRRFISIYLSGI
jgi:hypothetical protein